MNYVKMRSKGKGSLIFTPNDSDRVTVTHTITCCHSNHVFYVGPGRPDPMYCKMCDAYNCGQGRCARWPCVPFERKLEARERRFAIVEKAIENAFGADYYWRDE